MPALAPFEVNWLFTSENKREEGPSRKKKVEVIPMEKLLDEATAQDHEEFLEYLRQPIRTFRKSGREIREEYAYWLADRAAKRANGLAATTKTGRSHLKLLKIEERRTASIHRLGSSATRD